MIFMIDFVSIQTHVCTNFIVLFLLSLFHSIVTLSLHIVFITIYIYLILIIKPMELERRTNETSKIK